MNSKYLDVFLLVFISLHLLQGRFSKEIFISQTNLSKDNTTCGNSTTTPCRTIAYTISKIKEHGYIVNIDGSYNLASPYVYSINKTLCIDYSMELRKWVHGENNSAMPILMGKQQLIISDNITFTAIDFRAYHEKSDVNETRPMSDLIQVERTCSKINITGCLFYNLHSRFLHVKFSVKINLYITNSTIAIKLQEIKIFLSPSTYLNMKIYPNNIVIEDSHFRHDIIRTDNLYINKYLSNVEIKNCTFEETNLEFINEKFTLSDCKFNEVHLDLYTYLESNIKNCMFDKTTIQARMMRSQSKLYFYDTTFKNTRQSVFHQKAALQIETVYQNSADYTLRNPTDIKVALIRCSFRNNTVLDTNSASSLIIKLKLSSIILNHCEFDSSRSGRSIFSIWRRGTSISNTSVTCKAGEVLQIRLSRLSTSLLRGGYLDPLFELECKTCEDYTYILERKSFVTTPRYKKLHDNQKNNNNICIQCPYNGICKNGKVRLKGGYWGYQKIINNYMKNLMTITCPVNYCCMSKQQCTTYNTCAKHRTGRLCSECQQGFSTDISSKYRCTKNSDCNNGEITLVLYTILAVIFVVILLYLKEIVLFVKNLKKSKEDERVRKSDEDDEFPTLQLQERLIHECVIVGDRQPQIPYQILQTADDINSENYRNVSSYIVSGSIKIMLFFYQAATLIRIQSVDKIELVFPKFFDVISTVFNIKLDINHSKLVACILPNINVVQAKIIKLGFISIVFSVIMLIWVASFTYKTIKNRIKNPFQETAYRNTYTMIDDNVPSYSNPPFNVRIKCVYVQFLLIAYTSIAIFAFDAVHCVDINGGLYLYTQASIKCYKLWQYGVIAFIAFWVVPFSLSLYVGTKLLYQCSINPTQFLVMLTFPPTIPGLLVIRKFRFNKQQLSTEKAMLAKHLLLVINEPFRKSTTGDGSKLCWETMLISRRMLMVISQTFIMQPMLKLYPIAILLLLYVFHHMEMKPFSDAILNKIEFGSLLVLLSLVFVNMFWAVTTEYGITNNPIYSVFGEIAMYYEMLILSLPFILLACYISYSISRLFFRLCKRAYHVVTNKLNFQCFPI